jgi:hypothetical protein
VETQQLLANCAAKLIPHPLGGLATNISLWPVSRSENSSFALAMIALSGFISAGVTPRLSGDTRNPAPIVHATCGRSRACHLRDKSKIYGGVLWSGRFSTCAECCRRVKPGCGYASCGSATAGGGHTGTGLGRASCGSSSPGTRASCVIVEISASERAACTGSGRTPKRRSGAIVRQRSRGRST